MALKVTKLNQIVLHEAGPASSAKDTTYFLLHGIGTSLDFWGTIVPVLSADHRTIAVDIPGFGRSSSPEEGFTVHIAAAQIVTATNALDVQNGILVGHSLGAFIALRVAALEPTRFQRVVLVSGTLKRALEIIQRPVMTLRHPSFSLKVLMYFAVGTLPSKKRLASMMRHSPILRIIALQPWVGHSSKVDFDVLIAALSNDRGLSFARSLAAAYKVNYEELLQGVKQPVDLVWGASDGLISETDVEYVSNLLRVERKLVIPDCGHLPMIEFPSVLAQFIRNHPTPRGEVPAAAGEG
jgi:pimeloyl-ACP methyl ester carboxylesterase